MDSEEAEDLFLGFWVILGVSSLLILLFGGFVLVYSWVSPDAEISGWWLLWPILEGLGWIGIAFLEGDGKTLKNIKKDIHGSDKSP